MVRVIYSLGARLQQDSGGIGTTAYHAVQGLSRRGMLLRLLCGSIRSTEIPQSQIRSLGFPNRVLRKLASYDGSGRLWYAEGRVYDTWASRNLESADVLHVWGNYGLRSLSKAKRMGMLTVLERASSHPLCQSQLLSEEHARWGIPFRTYDAAVRQALTEIELADRVLVPSAFARQSFLDQGISPEKLLELPFGVDAGRFCPATGQPAHRFRVLYVGQVGVRKGVPYLLEAWRRLRWRDAELCIVGRMEAGFEPVLRRFSDLPGLEFGGHVPDPATLYQQADIFAFPSVEEGSALVTYEALACGLPVVTTFHAGSVVQDGSEGFIVPIRDVDALAGALERLRTDSALRGEMGRAARRRGEAFTWTRYGDDFAGRLHALAPGVAR